MTYIDNKILRFVQRYDANVLEVIDMHIKDSDDDYGAAFEHFWVKCLVKEQVTIAMIMNPELLVNTATPRIFEKTCLVDKHCFKLFENDKSPVLWV